MSLSRVKTWIAGEVLTASDLNAEVNNILNNSASLVFPVSANITWLSGTAFTGTFDHGITADRTWTFPDAAGTLTLGSSDVWTPALAINASAVGITYTTQVARYVKVKDMVFVTGSIALSSKGASVGNVTLTGLPFTSKTTASANPEDGFHVTSHLSVTGTAGSSMNFIVGSAATTASLLLLTDTSTVNVADTNLSNTSALLFSGIYQAAS